MGLLGPSMELGEAEFRKPGPHGRAGGVGAAGLSLLRLPLRARKTLQMHLKEQPLFFLAVVVWSWLGTAFLGLYPFTHPCECPLLIGGFFSVLALCAFCENGFNHRLFFKSNQLY